MKRKRRTGRLSLKRAPKAKIASISKLVKQADSLFSIQTRKKGADKDGLIACYTCGRKYHWKKLHCGHYLSRFYKAARWDEDNCRPQCMMCNLWKRGDHIIFRQNLVKEIGEERVLAVEAKRSQIIKLTREFLTDLVGKIEKYGMPT